MLGFIAWAFALAYGRMSDDISWKPFVIFGGLAAVFAILAQQAGSPSFAFDLGGQWAVLAVLFTLGYYFGRWRDSGKQDGRFSD